MASKPKDQVKEKRGTSPSFPRLGDPAQRRKSPSPAAAAPGEKNASASASTSTEKQVPNYLKPTVSSKLDPSSSKPNVKKQPSSDKPSTQLTRRRSFDKPPSPSRVPKPHATSPNSSEKSLRSSSFSSKTSPFPKSNLEKLSKVTKDVGKHSSLQQPRPSNVRKSIATNSKKQNNGSSSTTSLTTKALKRTTSPSQPEIQEKYQQESLPTEAEEINDKNISTENLTLEEDKEHEDAINEEELDEDEELKLCDTSTVTEDHSEPLSVDVEDTRAETPTEENGNNNHQEAEEQQRKEEISENHHHQEKATYAGEVEVDEEKKETGEEIASLNPKENSSEAKEEVVESKDALKSEEITQVERVGKGSKPEVAENVVKKSQGPAGPQGKKDTAAYNDVIEETASKLREQRKNKVRALVGAFETVISLESETTPE